MKEYLPLAITQDGSHRIPKIFLQVFKESESDEVIQALLRHAPGYTYINMTDKECLHQHPMEEFPNLIDKFHSFHKGAHKADLFRYVFLYQNGGIFIDSGMMIYHNLDCVIGNHDFVTIRGFHIAIDP